MNKEIVLDIDGSHNGYDYVDLGLPSGTKWATCNVGADKPEDLGLLFQFGRVDGYAYGDKNNKFSTPDENKNTTGNEYINPTTSGIKYDVGQKLNLEDDAAHVNMGGDWVMPTKEDLQELYDNTKHEVVTINGKKGMLLTSKINGKSIFVVFAGNRYFYYGRFYDRGSAGYLRSSEVYSDIPGYAWCLDFDSSGNCNIDGSTRANGYSVRGVLKNNSDITTPTPTPTLTPTPTTKPSINIETLNKGDGSHNGYDYIDLGLPSGTKWATCNVGAYTPEDPGLLFQFGRVDGYRYGDENHKFRTTEQNKKDTKDKYIPKTTSGKIYCEGETLNLDDDAAHVNMGGDWIMPTNDDLQELYNNTTRRVVTINGKKGLLFTSNFNDKSIFVVLGGYWDYHSGQFRGSDYGYLRSSDVISSNAQYSPILYCEYSGYCEIRNLIRANGYCVRGVIKQNKTKYVKEINLDYLL